jgi:hypothetical protein
MREAKKNKILFYLISEENKQVKHQKWDHRTVQKYPAEEQKDITSLE